MNKKLTMMVVGGGGYVGSAILKEALRFPSINLISVQRGAPQNFVDAKVNYVTGSALTPETFREEVKSADVIVHSLGVLIDSTFTKYASQGAEGSYEQVNYETAKVLGDYVNSFTDKKRKFFYLSAGQGIPFVPRYLDTKRKAERYLSTLPNIEFKAFYPGLIVDSQERAITAPLGLLMDASAQIQKTFPFNQLADVKYLGDFLSNFKVDHSIQRQDLARAIIYCALEHSYDAQKIMEYDQMVDASSRLANLQ